MNLVTALAGDPRIDAFHRGIYWDEFAEQHEPVASWHAALRGEKPQRMHIELALDGEAIVGGICYEQYPRTRCGLLTYVVVAPAARGQGLGKRLVLTAAETLAKAGAPLVLGELNDPRVTTLEPADEAWRRLRLQQGWGARVVDARYIQPSLGDGLARDRQLLLVAFPPLPTAIDGALLRAFLTELYEATEGGPPDSEIAIPDVVPLIAL